VCQLNRVPAGIGKVATKKPSGEQAGDCPVRDIPWQLTRYARAVAGRSVGSVNENHAKLLGSAEWAAHLHEDILPAVTGGVDLGDDLLEIGPGPGAASEWLRHRVRRLVALELDPAATAALRDRFGGTNVEAVTGDATALRYPNASFDSVGMFTMLHHVPTRALQDKILAEALRVLRPGGTLIGSDSLPSDGLHHFHAGDTYNPVEPAALLTRLQTIGFGEITITVGHTLLFRARKEAEEESA
jgi:SAM-dependent methyltransferase